MSLVESLAASSSLTGLSQSLLEVIPANLEVQHPQEGEDLEALKAQCRREDEDLQYLTHPLRHREDEDVQ